MSEAAERNTTPAGGHEPGGLHKLLKSRGTDVAFCVGAIAALLATFPWGGTTPLDDDWDFFADLLDKPFHEAVLTPSNGHFLPVHKALYGATLLISGFTSLAPAIAQHAIRLGILLCLRAVLRSVGAWSVESAFLVLATAFNQAGLEGGFRWPWSANFELAFLGFVLAVYFLTAAGEERRASWPLAVACSLSILSSNVGIGATIGLPVAALIAHVRGRGRVRADFLTVTAVVLAIDALWALGGGGAGVKAQTLTLGNAMNPLDKVLAAGKYFAYLTLANSAPAGLVLGTTSGVVNAAFAVALFVASMWVVLKSANLRRAMATGALLTGHLAINTLIAASRWPHGIQHAGSYRYVLLSTFFQLPLLAFCLAEGRERLRGRWMALVSLGLATIILLAAGVGGFRGRARAEQESKQRAACLQSLTDGATDLSCLEGTVGYQTPQRVREIWLAIGPRP